MKEQFRHAKPLLVFGTGAELLTEAKIPTKMSSGDDDPGVIVAGQAEKESAVERFIAALAGHRNFMRQSDPPTV